MRLGSGNAEHTIRIRIRSNAYVAQSYGIVERWDGAQWRQVAQRDGVELASKPQQYLGNGTHTGVVSYVAPLTNEGRDAFFADRDTLVAAAREVLG